MEHLVVEGIDVYHQSATADVHFECLEAILRAQLIVTAIAALIDLVHVA